MARLPLPHFPPDTRAFIESLNTHGVEYVLVGAYAIAWHGHMRYTKDADFFVRGTLENGEKLVAALTAFGLAESLEVRPEDFLEQNLCLYFGREPWRVDLLTGVDGVTFEEVWTNRVTADWDGVRVNVAGREELIRNKRSTGRPQDAADASVLEARG